jgi:hypothetical protein
MQLSAVKDKYKHQTVYIIGTGPSLRVFPVDILEKEITIGLNQAYKSLQFRPTYNLTIHPELIPKYEPLRWITKRKGQTIKWHESQAYWFENNVDVLDFSYLI